MKRLSKLKLLSFQSKLERISDEAEYFGISVPPKITEALKTKGPVPVSAQFNGSSSYIVSLYSVGGGRHSIRMKAQIRNEAKIKEGDRVHVEMEVLEHSSEIFIPKDLVSALRTEGVLEAFKSLTIGKRRHLIGYIEEAAKPETREKRIQSVVEAAHEKREKQLDRKVKP